MRGLTTAFACALAACSGKETMGPPASIDSGVSTPASAKWACLDHPAVPVARDPLPVTYVVSIVDFDSSPTAPTAVPGLVVTVCDTAECARQIEGVTVGHGAAGPAYEYTVTFPFTFANAYLRLSAPGYVQLNYFLGGPMIGTADGATRVTGLQLSLLRTDTFERLARSLQLPVPIDATRGTLAVRVLDCLGHRAAGISLNVESTALDPGRVAWSLSLGNYATPGASVTTERGVAGIANAAPDVVIVHGSRVTDDGTERSIFGPIRVPIWPAAISLVELRDGLGAWGQ